MSLHPHPIYDFFRRDNTTPEEARKHIGAGSEPIILFFGYIRPYKGLLYLLRAMPEIKNRIGARLIVVGEFYEDKEPYIREVRELAIEDSVEFVDRYVPNEEVEKYFLASDLVVLPYLSATQSGIVQIAMAFDKPMVVTSVGGLPDVVAEGKTGFIVPPEDSGAIAEAVIRFFKEGWAERMQKYFPTEKERFSWKSMVSTLEDLIRNVSQ